MSIKLNKYEKDWQIAFAVSSYRYGGGLAIEMYSVGEDYPEMFSILTINLEDFPTEENRAFVDTNNLSYEIIDWIIDNNLGELTGRIGLSGYCSYPEVRFNLDEINKHLMED